MCSQAINKYLVGLVNYRLDIKISLVFLEEVNSHCLQEIMRVLSAKVINYDAKLKLNRVRVSYERAIKA